MYCELVCVQVYSCSKWISESLIDRSRTCEGVAGVRYCPNTGCVWAQGVGVHLRETKNQRVWRRKGCMCL